MTRQHIIEKYLPVLHNVLVQILIANSFKDILRPRFYRKINHDELIDNVKMNVYEMFEFIFKVPLISYDFTKLYKEKQQKTYFHSMETKSKSN